MLVFNGSNYPVRGNLEIISPLNLVDYTQMLLNGESPEGFIVSLNKREKGIIEISNEELLSYLLKCNHIEPKLLQIEQCQGMSVAELQNISDILPPRLTIDEIKSFLELNKHEKEILLQSGYSNEELTACFLSLLKAKEKFGPHIEYTLSLNEFLHENYFFNPTYIYSPEQPTIQELIGIYYQYPQISNALMEYNRKEFDCFFESIHPSLRDIISNSIELEQDWVFGEKHISKLDDVEKLFLEYGIGGSIDLLTKMNEILQVKDDYFLPEMWKSADFFDSTSSPMAIMVQPSVDDDTKYIIQEFDELAKDMRVEPYESFEIKALNLKMEYSEIDTFGDNETIKYEIAKQIFDKINAIVMQDSKKHCIPFEPLSWNDMLSSMDEYFEKIHMPISAIMTEGIIQIALRIMDEKTNYSNIPGLENIEILHLAGEKFIFSSENYFLKCYKAEDRMSPFVEPMYIMPDNIIKKMQLPTLKSLEEMIIYDKDIIYAMQNKGFYGIRDEIQKKIANKVPITELRKNSYDELAEKFKEKYGRVPRILPQISIAIKKFFNNMQECVDSFNYKSIAKILGAKTPIMIKLSSAFDWNQTPNDLQQLLKYYVTSQNVNTICKYPDIIIEFYKNAKDKDFLQFIDIINKIPDQSLMTLSNKIKQLQTTTNIEEKNQLRNNIYDNIRAFILVAQQERGLIDAHKAEESYGYQIINNSSNIMGDNICIMSGPYRMYFLNSMDYRHFSVGYDTSCCQHYGGAGEECVVAATSSPYCGTLIIETHDGTIKAQAFTWESFDKNGNKVLVLDNIEFANDRSANDYIEMLYAFCKESPYETIHMGLAYNAIANIGRPISEDEFVKQPMNPYIREEFYSDYDNAIALKTNGQIEFQSPNTKYYTQTFETPTMIESTSHCISKIDDSLIAQHYDEPYDESSKTTIVISHDGTKKEANAILPTYPFNGETPLSHNYIMKWDSIEPGDIAISVVHTNDIFIIRPISFDGQEIVCPNKEQRDAIFQAVQELTTSFPDDDIALIFPNLNKRDKIISTSDDLLDINTDGYRSNITGTIYCTELIGFETLYDMEKLPEECEIC